MSDGGIRVSYPYTPLENFFEGDSANTGKVETPEEVLQRRCAKTGRGSLSYAEKQTEEEFRRFYHRSLEGAVIMIGVVLASLGSQITTIPCAFFGVAEIIIHCVYKAGPKFTPKVALTRRWMHILAFFFLTLEVAVNGAYTRSEGCKPPEEKIAVAPWQRGCVPTLHWGESVNIIFNVLLLSTGAQTHIGLLTFFYVPVKLLTYVVSYVFFYPGENFVKGQLIPPVRELVARICVSLLLVVVSNLCAVARHRFNQRGFEGVLLVQFQLKAGKKRLASVDSLMSTLVPASALATLMKGETVYDCADEATVLFSDMVQFTRWSSVRTPKQVVDLLAVLIRKFDVLASDLEINKVKTIGDCYWAVTGLPLASLEHHAELMVKFGLQMLKVVDSEGKKHQEWDYPEPQAEEANLPLCLVTDSHGRRIIQFRTGIHSGPVNAGVLGTQQITYEIFGETSALANEVEANGVGGRVAVSKKTMELIQENEEINGDKENPVFQFVSVQQFRTTPTSDDELFIVRFSSNNSDDDNASLRGSCAQSIAPSIASATHSQQRAEAKARQKLVTSKFGRGAEGKYLLEDNDPESELSPQELANRYSATASYSLLTFADPATEAEYERFVVQELIELRVKGLTTFLVVLTFLFIVVLATTTPALLSVVTLVLWALVEMILCCCLQLTIKRRADLQSTPLEETQLSKLYDYLVPALSLLAIELWVISAIFSEGSLILNNSYWLTLVAFFCLELPNAHFSWKVIVLNGLVLRATCILTIQGPPITLIFATAFFVFGIAYMIIRIFRVQFIQSKVARTLSSQLEATTNTQASILGSMLPDFVVAPLSAWIESDFDPSRALVRNYDEMCVAFLRMNPSSISAPTETSRYTQPSEPTLLSPTVHSVGHRGSVSTSTAHSWLFDGHLVIDEVLLGAARGGAVDKVKTVGDLVIVAGSFRGHSSEEAHVAMLEAISQIFTKFESNTLTIGLHTGPVMGIVIGYSRLAFDIFGDTVNTTSRVMTNADSKHRVTASLDFLQRLPKRNQKEETIGCSHNDEDGGDDWGPIRELLAKGKGVLRVREVLLRQPPKEVLSRVIDPTDQKVRVSDLVDQEVSPTEQGLSHPSPAGC